MQVEIYVGRGLPGFSVVGLPTRTVREAEQRIRGAIEASDEEWPNVRVTTNLAPGRLRKDGTHFDLAMACAVMAAKKQLPVDAIRGWVMIGELGLEGSVRPVPGALAAAIACREAGLKGVICAPANAGEAALVEDIDVVPVESLRDCIGFFSGSYDPPAVAPAATDDRSGDEDISEVRGQTEAKRAIEVAAAGGHNLLLFGPPGAGKTMLARRMPGILPRLTQEEALDVTRVHSVAGLLTDHARLITKRPFRSPHHHISSAGLIGGGTGLARPGEVALAHPSIAICS